MKICGARDLALLLCICSGLCALSGREVITAGNEVAASPGTSELSRREPTRSKSVSVFNERESSLPASIQDTSFQSTFPQLSASSGLWHSNSTSSAQPSADSYLAAFWDRSRPFEDRAVSLLRYRRLTDVSLNSAEILEAIELGLGALDERGTAHLVCALAESTQFLNIEAIAYIAINSMCAEVRSACIELFASRKSSALARSALENLAKSDPEAELRAQANDAMLPFHSDSDE